MIGLRVNPKAIGTSVLAFLICFVYFLFISAKTLAQADSCNYTVSGKILDIDTKKPVAFATVKVRGGDKNTITNIDGEFSIDGLCDERNTLIISCLGYCDTTCEDHHQHGRAPHIYLTHEVKDLKPLTIKAERETIKGTESLSQVQIKKADLRLNPTRSLAASIAENQGVSFTSMGSNVQLPVIHGLYGNRILILNNGIKHGFQNWGRDHAPEIDISNAHRITVVRGAAGVKYGPEAIGGAIVVENNPLYLNEVFKAEVGTGYQSNGRGYYVNSEISHGMRKWSYHLGANYTRIGDLYAPDYSLTNSGREERSVNGGLRFHHKGFDLKAFYSYLDQDLALLRSSIAHSGNAFVRSISSDQPNYISPFSYDIDKPNQQVQHHLAKLELNWIYTDEAKLTFRYGRQFNQRDEFDVRRNANLPIIDLDLSTEDYQIEWKHPDWLTLDGLVGFQMFTQLNNNNPGTLVTPLVPNYRSLRFSAFIIENFKREKNTYEVGVRVDHETNNVAGRQQNQEVFVDDFSFTNLTASIGFVREISEYSTFRSNIGTAWRSPNMLELYSFGQHGFRTTFGLLRHYYNSEGAPRTDRVLGLGEAGINPERGYKFINEYKTSKRKNRHTATFYTQFIEDFIYERPLGVFGTVRGPMPAFVYVQHDVLFLGLDYSWERNFHKQITGRLGLSYLWSQNIEKKENLINQAPISAVYQLTWRQKKLWKLTSSKVSLTPGYTFQQFQAPRTIAPEDLIEQTVKIDDSSEIFDFKDAPPGYFLLNASWSFAWKKLNGSISVNNILNTRYRDYLNDMRYFADEPGRNLLFNLNYRIG